MQRLLFALLAAHAAADISGLFDALDEAGREQPGLFDALDDAEALLAPDHAAAETRARAAQSTLLVV
jgi:hypothetical protein